MCKRCEHSVMVVDFITYVPSGLQWRCEGLRKHQWGSTCNAVHVIDMGNTHVMCMKLWRDIAHLIIC